MRFIDKPGRLAQGCMSPTCSILSVARMIEALLADRARWEEPFISRTVCIHGDCGSWRAQLTRPSPISEEELVIFRVPQASPGFAHILLGNIIRNRRGYFFNIPKACLSWLSNVGIISKREYRTCGGVKILRLCGRPADGQSGSR